MRTPTPPRITHTVANLDFLDQRPVSDAIDEINADKFVQKTFNSAAETKNEKEEEVLKVKGEPKVVKFDANDDPLFHKSVSIIRIQLQCLRKRWIPIYVNKTIFI